MSKHSAKPRQLVIIHLETFYQWKEQRFLDAAGKPGVRYRCSHGTKGTLRVEPGAFTRTLAHKGGEVPILFAHDARQPIGLGKVVESAKGLQIEGELELQVEKAREAYALMKRGILKGLSIGYDTIRDTVVNGVRHLQELKLYEVSIVTFPMNELATVSSVKSEDLIADQVRLFRETLRAAEKSFAR
jgi:HK97 family phage prohead protease